MPCARGREFPSPERRRRRAAQMKNFVSGGLRVAGRRAGRGAGGARDPELRGVAGASDVRVELDVLRRGDLDAHALGDANTRGLVEQLLVARAVPGRPGGGVRTVSGRRELRALDVEVVAVEAQEPAAAAGELLGVEPQLAAGLGAAF